VDFGGCFLEKRDQPVSSSPALSRFALHSFVGQTPLGIPFIYLLKILEQKLARVGGQGEAPCDRDSESR